MNSKLFKSFVLIFIALSLFSCVFADSYDSINGSYLIISGHDHKDVEGDGAIDVVQREEQGDPGRITEVYVQNGNSNFYFKPAAGKTGLYAISCVTMPNFRDRDNEGIQTTYRVMDTSNPSGSAEKKGLHLRIPACYNKDSDTYTLYSNFISPNNGATHTVVFLQEGQEYCFYFTGGWNTNAKATIRYLPPGSEINGVKVVPNDEVFLSGYSTEDRTMKRAEKTTKSLLSSADQSGVKGIPSGTNPAKIRTPDDKPASALFKSDNPFEISLVSLLLAIGDFFVQLINKVVGEDITITRLIFNQVKAVNVNFFSMAARAGTFGGVAVGDAINKWFQLFRVVAIMCYLITLLAIGINVLLNSTAQGIQKAKDYLVQWIKGIAILFLMPLAMRYVFQINEALVRMVQQANKFDNEEIKTAVLKTGSSFADSNVWSTTHLEFRSPEYISKYTGQVTYGTSEATARYMSRIQDYKNTLDLMNIMRAYAGASGRLGYTVIWYVLIGQLMVFLFIYYKRYFIIAFLIAVFPVTCIFNAISIMQGKRGPQMNTWFKEFLTNVFTQFFHAVIYSIITGVVVEMVINSFKNPVASRKCKLGNHYCCN